MKIFNILIPKKRYTQRPICPECGEETIVLFTPPIPNTMKADYGKAHLYCCNGETNCKYSPF